MRKLRFFMPIGLLLVMALFGAIVMLLWNWVVPSIFGLTAISFWQALGLFALTRILFGGFGFFKRARMMHEMHHVKNPIHKKWMNMSAEQRKAFIEKRRKFGFGCPHPFDMEENDEEHRSEEK